MENYIIQQYKNDISIAQLERELNIPRRKITEIIRDYGLEIRVGRRKSCYINDGYFNEIDTEDKAYWFGFLYADGFITKNGFALTLMRSDRSHIEKMAKYMESTYKIGDYIGTGFDKKPIKSSKTSITSRELREALVSKGMIPNKSLVLEPPKGVPSELIKHFIRGFFDGNGSISGNKKSTYTVKICSTDAMLNWILKECDIEIPKLTKRRPTDVVSSIELHALKMMKFLDFIYKDCSVYLNRKYAKYIKVSKERGCI